MPNPPDTARFHDALDRANRLRQRAIDYRKIAETSYLPADWLFGACKFDSRADVILEAMKAGKTVPVDFGNEPFKG